MYIEVHYKQPHEYDEVKKAAILLSDLFSCSIHIIDDREIKNKCQEKTNLPASL